MFSKLSTSFALLLAIHAHGHALVSPDLNGGTARADVTRPSTAEPCGAGVDVASLINTAKAVPVIDSNINANITNFNGGTDGSTFVTAQIDPTGTGKNFVDATVTTNGVKDPTTVGTVPLVVQVPAGTKATGGTAGNRMLVAFKTLGGFGNCIAATTGDATASSDTTTAASDTGAAATGDSAAAAADKKTAAKTTTTAKSAGAAADAGAAKAKDAAGAKDAGAAKAKDAAGAKKAKAKGAKKGDKKKAAKAGAGAQKAAKKAKKHRDIQKLRLRNAVAELISNSESE